MSSIQSQATVKAPLASAQRFVEAFFDAHRRADDTASIVLHAGKLEAPAEVTLEASRRAGEMTPNFAVTWKSAEPGPYPYFTGVVDVVAGEDYDMFTLDLSGTYDPPLGIAGVIFDAVVGHRVAQATADELLETIKADVERRFASEEAAKPA